MKKIYLIEWTSDLVAFKSMSKSVKYLNSKKGFEIQIKDVKIRIKEGGAFLHEHDGEEYRIIEVQLF